MAELRPLWILALAALAWLPGCGGAPEATSTAPVSVSASPAASPSAAPTAAGAPPARTRAAAAYDSVRLEVLLFGGRSPAGGEVLGDTWVFDGRAWAARRSPHPPPARLGAAIAFDPRARATLLFGGVDASGRALRDTWRWDGADWQQLAPPTTPGLDSEVALADDEAGRRLLLVGCCAPGGALRTYGWTGDDWRELGGAGPPGGDQPVMAADAAGGGVLLLQAVAPGTPAAGTWRWDGAAWSPLAPPNLPPWNGSTPAAPGSPVQFLASDSAHHVVVMVLEAPAGAGATLLWDGAAWTLVAGAPSPPRVSLMVGDAGHAGFLLVGGPSTAQDTAGVLRRSDGPWIPVPSS